MTLDQLPKNVMARIVAMEGDDELRRKLLNLDISLNSNVRFLRKAPFGNPFEYLIGDNIVAVRKNITKKIQIELC